MAELGIMTNCEDVLSWEMTAYSIISSQINKLEKEQFKGAKNGARRNN